MKTLHGRLREPWSRFFPDTGNLQPRHSPHVFGGLVQTSSIGSSLPRHLPQRQHLPRWPAPRPGSPDSRIGEPQADTQMAGFPNSRLPFRPTAGPQNLQKSAAGESGTLRKRARWVGLSPDLQCTQTTVPKPAIPEILNSPSLNPEQLL